MTVGGLANHLVAQVDIAVRLLGWRAGGAAPDPAPRALPPGGLGAHRAWTRTPTPPSATGANARGAGRASKGSWPGWPARWPALPATLAAAEGREPDSWLIPWQGWALTAHDLLVTRLMEMMVHSDDLAASIGVETPQFPDDVVAVVLGLLLGRRGRAARSDRRWSGRCPGLSARRPHVSAFWRMTAGRRAGAVRPDAARPGRGRRRAVAGAVADGRAVRRRSCSPRATGATSWTATATGRSRRSSPTSTPAGTTSTSRSRTGSTTSTSARSCASANAFLAREVHIVGNRRWNRRGAMVTDRYQHVRHHADVAGAGGVPPRPAGRPGAAARASTTCPARCPSRPPTLPRRVCFLFGQEGPGLSDAARAACDATFSIAQFGSTRSINAAAAAAIAMHAWVRARHADLCAEDVPDGARGRRA